MNELIQKINDFLEKGFINYYQTPEERRAKYALARSMGMKPVLARQFRDTHTPKIFRVLGKPVPPLKERKRMLSEFGFNKSLVERIDAFIDKQFRWEDLSPEQREQMKRKYPEVEPFVKPSKVPEAEPSKIPKIKQLRQPKLVREKEPRMEPKLGIIGEIGRQLTPKSPYRSPSDIVEDVSEAKRIGRKVGALFGGKD